MQINLKQVPEYFIGKMPVITITHRPTEKEKAEMLAARINKILMEIEKDETNANRDV